MRRRLILLARMVICQCHTHWHLLHLLPTPIPTERQAYKHNVQGPILMQDFIHRSISPASATAGSYYKQRDRAQTWIHIQGTTDSTRPSPRMMIQVQGVPLAFAPSSTFALTWPLQTEYSYVSIEEYKLGLQEVCLRSPKNHTRAARASLTTWFYVPSKDFTQPKVCSPFRAEVQ
jgi:hypothetical protein